MTFIHNDPCFDRYPGLFLLGQTLENVVDREQLLNEARSVLQELAHALRALSGDSTPTGAVCGLCGKSGEHLGREQKTCWIGAAALSGDTEPPKHAGFDPSCKYCRRGDCASADVVRGDTEPPKRSHQGPCATCGRSTMVQVGDEWFCSSTCYDELQQLRAASSPEGTAKP